MDMFAEFKEVIPFYFLAATSQRAFGKLAVTLSRTSARVVIKLVQLKFSVHQ